MRLKIITAPEDRHTCHALYTMTGRPSIRAICCTYTRRSRKDNNALTAGDRLRTSDEVVNASRSATDKSNVKRGQRNTGDMRGLPERTFCTL